MRSYFPWMPDGWPYVSTIPMLEATTNCIALFYQWQAGDLTDLAVLQWLNRRNLLPINWLMLAHQVY